MSTSAAGRLSGLCVQMHGAGAEAGETSTKVRVELSGVHVQGHDAGVQAGEARWSRHAQRTVRGGAEQASVPCSSTTPVWVWFAACHGERRSAGKTAKGSSKSGKQVNGWHEHADRAVARAHGEGERLNADGGARAESKAEGHLGSTKGKGVQSGRVRAQAQWDGVEHACKSVGDSASTSGCQQVGLHKQGIRGSIQEARARQKRAGERKWSTWYLKKRIHAPSAGVDQGAQNAGKAAGTKQEKNGPAAPHSHDRSVGIKIGSISSDSKRTEAN
ncbi:hypothetical protein B0H14DRAFT_2607003 [Mycena olivaceomarginata]|nr:hypothetical protein B0H14DRAFT_2607003 [Mycena olivaceomarginata]